MRKKIPFVLVFLLFVFSCLARATSPIFQLMNTYNSGGVGPVSVDIADLNRDGKLDVVVASQCTVNKACPGDGTVSVLLGNGDGTLQLAHTYKSGGQYASWVVVSDVNGDGKLDLVVANEWAVYGQAGAVGILFGNGDGTFQNPVSFLSGGYYSTGVAVADFNHDGIPDLAISDWSNSCTDGSCTGPGSVSILLGSGHGNFQPAKTYESGAYTADSIVAADLNGDGTSDLVVGHDGHIGVLLGKGDGTFSPATVYPSGGRYKSWIAVDNVNRDRALDLLVINHQTSLSNRRGRVAILLGNGDGTFAPMQTYRSGGNEATAIAVLDLNRDHNLDILVSDTWGLNVLWGYGDGSFVRTAAGPFVARAMAVADLDGDTRTDVVELFNDQVNVLRNIIPFSTTTTLTSSLNPSIYGEAVTLTATVTSDGTFPPSGKVVFKSNGVGIGSAAVQGGVATLTKTNLPAGTLLITAQYSGDSNSGESVSEVVAQVVAKASTITTITSSANPSGQGQPVTFTAKVISKTAKVTGTVTFTAGNVTLATVTLTSQKASVTTSALPVGSTEIKATYNGTVNIFGSSASLLQIVN
jgi:hypothetical protein